MLAAPFMTRRLTKEFIEKNGRSPTKDEFIEIQREAVTTLINSNSVYGILGQGGTEMSENVSKGKPTEEQVIVHTLGMKVVYTPKPFGECEHPDSENLKRELSGKKSNFLPGGIRDRYSFKNMTKEMYENFVKQGKKFVICTGQEFDSLEKAGIDLDGDVITVDGQNYIVDNSTLRR